MFYFHYLLCKIIFLISMENAPRADSDHLYVGHGLDLLLAREEHLARAEVC